MFHEGQRINHLGHGLGTILQVRASNRESISDRTMGALALSAPVPILTEAFYSSDRYPYIVQFDNGHRDVYGDTELTEA